MNLRDNKKRIKNLSDMVEYYLHSPQFLALRPQTQKGYEYRLSSVLETPASSTSRMGDIKLHKLSVAHCKSAYQMWLKRGVRTANVMATTTSIVLNMAEELELIMRNPMRSVSKMKERGRKVMWSADQVKVFLSTAYSQYKWRSIGLIVHMAYSFAQRVGDMRSLEWTNLNFDEERLDLEQSKKRAEVHLPIEKDLLSMLRKHHEEFGFQQYVAPHPYPKGGEYRIYNDVDISPMFNKVKHEAQLPKELTAMDMRRTAITEMVEAGVDTTQIMAVSGHNSPNSIAPYIKHTYTSANNALSKREKYKNA